MKALAAAFIFSIVLLPFSTSAETEAERKERLEQQLQQVERQILTQRRLVEDKQLERQSLERDINIIEGEIEKAQLGIKARELALQQLTGQIGDKIEVLKILDERLLKQQRSLADLIRKSNEVDSYSLVEVLLSNQRFSDFFTDYERFQSIKSSLNESLSILHEIKSDTLEQKDQLEEKQTQEAQLKKVQEIEKQEIHVKEKEKEQILQVTKGEEAAYQQLLESQQKTASQLRAQLFELLGGGAAIPFPEAVQLAKDASAYTGVPAALILAILEQETSYGSNLGSCTVGDLIDGKPIMHPERDQPVFTAMANALGFSEVSQVVSCPLRSGGTRIGWGGAMGPSQFIPSTWAIYGGFVNTGAGWQYNQAQDAIRSLLKKSTPGNPYVNQDAFLATALLLRDNGSDGTYNNDRMAALRYYAGWGGATRPENQFYGDGVMQRKSRLVQEIQIIGQ